MRLSSGETGIIIKILENYSSECVVYLHGSRVDDSLKGGDIDLFMVVSSLEYINISNTKHYIESELVRNLREQRVDLTILSTEDAASNNFFINSKKIKLVT